jgi:hypothetical protein
VKSHHAGEQLREESLGVPEERALALDAPELLEERQGQDPSESESRFMAS